MDRLEIVNSRMCVLETEDVRFRAQRFPLEPRPLKPLTYILNEQLLLKCYNSGYNICAECLSCTQIRLVPHWAAQTMLEICHMLKYRKTNRFPLCECIGHHM